MACGLEVSCSLDDAVNIACGRWQYVPNLRMPDLGRHELRVVVKLAEH